MKEEALIESRSVRDDFCRDEYLDILDRVGSLVTLPETGWATAEAVAEFYSVPVETIRTIIRRNKDELNSDGYKVLSKKELEKFHYETFEIPNRGLAIFTRRAVLRIGMLLRDSEVAKQVRTYLLNVEALSIPGSDALQRMAAQLSIQAREVASHASMLSVHHEQLNKNAAQLVLQADMIRSTVRTVGETKQEVHQMKDTIRSHDIRLLALENAQHNHPIVLECLSPEQIAILKTRVQSIGRPITVWSQFNKHFGITRYKFLSASRFEEALAWIESYTENP